MKTFAALLLSLVLLVTMAALAADPPDKIVFETKMGNVTFDHQAHVKRMQGKCEDCHDKLFPQSRAPIHFKEKMHRPAEADKTSCGGCHHPGGRAFETKGNCKKCHVK